MYELEIFLFNGKSLNLLINKEELYQINSSTDNAVSLTKFCDLTLLSILFTTLLVNYVRVLTSQTHSFRSVT